MQNLNLKDSHILVVDDEQSNIDVLLGLLEMKGYVNVYQATDPRLIPAIFQEIKPDIILLDLMMPHLNGFQVMEQLKLLIPENTYLPILVLTADVTTDSKLRALAGGAKDFLTKPFDLTEVDLRIVNLLQTRYLHSQLQNQNKILEEKVVQRTMRLQDTIIELEVAKNKAEASDRLKTAFLNNISHEVRTPINGILGFSQIIAQGDTNEEEKQMYLDMLDESCTRLINTITNFMDISLIVSGNLKVKPVPVDIFRLMENQYEALKDKCASKGLELRLELPKRTDSLILKTDNELIKKMIFHIADNAVKFTSSGEVVLGCKVHQEELELFVHDTGLGILEESKNLVFDRFMQENVSNTRAYEGSGLGLSITKGFAELLGGRLFLESKKDRGTRVSISFPILS